MKVAVLGAGYMGSAMACVARRRGHEVRLWGTWLDDAMLDPCERGEPHPRLKLTLEGIALFRAPRLADALAGAELVVHAINSDGALPVMERAAPHLPDAPVLSVTKGLLEAKNGRMDRIDRVVPERIGRAVRYVHAAGPAKAVEVARGVLTWMEFAGPDAAACARALEGGGLVVSTTDDIAGAELCSALKNAYATGLGLWDGHVGANAHDARAAGFTQSIAEMRALVVAAGGREATVYGPAGVGDLHVTAAAGRNRAFGERVGKGRPAREVAAEMLAAGELTEGYPAIATAWRFARERGVGPLPLLAALHAIVWEGAEVGATLEAFAAAWARAISGATSPGR
ncbi:MAG TPA: NAD(P)H-dependent glycerol-3-phosphate dehydrogenase [Polyangiaceae bacterium]|jgi:glycerol-3-phosphate dehydrogenase (NAD(P)+)|nr:NAD(P)H-dependent glycerol-3-phosphate dehydrogenase [Polyangiaceae bacterium]